jgi:hypothetical protein
VDKLEQQGSESQEVAAESPALDLLITDLRDIRAKMLATEKRRRSGILAGQVLILARSYQAGRRPSHRSLKRFLWFLSRELAA